MVQRPGQKRRRQRCEQSEYGERNRGADPAGEVARDRVPGNRDALRTVAGERVWALARLGAEGDGDQRDREGHERGDVRDGQRPGDPLGEGAGDERPEADPTEVGGSVHRAEPVADNSRPL